MEVSDFQKQIQQEYEEVGDPFDAQILTQEEENYCDYEELIKNEEILYSMVKDLPANENEEFILVEKDSDGHNFTKEGKPFFGQHIRKAKGTSIDNIKQFFVNKLYEPFFSLFYNCLV